MSNYDPQNDLALTNAPIWRFLRRLVIVVVAIPLVVVAVKWALRVHTQNFNIKHLERQLQLMRERKKSNIEFYSTDYTDQAVQHLRGNAEVEYIAFNLTDISDLGLAELTTLPNLKGLLLYGGQGIGIKSIAHLKRMPKLERLILNNTQINDDGVLLLKELPALRHLGLHDDKSRGLTITENALVHLKQFNNLKSLDLSGRWVKPEMFDQLKKSLSSCRINQFPNYYPDSVFELY